MNFSPGPRKASSLQCSCRVEPKGAVLHDHSAVLSARPLRCAPDVRQRCARGEQLGIDDELDHGAVFPLGFTGAEEATKKGFTVSTTQVRSNGSQLAELGRLLAQGTVRVSVDGTYALSQARQAHERAARGHIQGKIVMTVD